MIHVCWRCSTTYNPHRRVDTRPFSVQVLLVRSILSGQVRCYFAPALSRSLPFNILGPLAPQGRVESGSAEYSQALVWCNVLQYPPVVGVRPAWNKILWGWPRTLCCISHTRPAVGFCLSNRAWDFQRRVALLPCDVTFACFCQLTDCNLLRQ